MRIVHLTPGSGGSFYCENCLRDNDLVKAERAAGHDAMLVPLYLPILGEDAAAGAVAGTPVFFGGINVYLEQKWAFFRYAPRWLHRLLDAGPLLKLAAKMAGMTRAAGLGGTTISMLRGEHGRQALELEKLVAWLVTHEKPDVVCLSNALLVGFARRLKDALKVPVICALQGEHSFLDGLNEPERTQAWATLKERARDVDRFIASSFYYRDEMVKRLDLPPEKVAVVHNGIPAGEYESAAEALDPPVVGYLARMCQGGGLDVLADALIIIKGRGRIGRLRLRAAGGKTADDDAFIASCRERLDEGGLGPDAEILPNLGRAEKRAFLKGLTLLSVPSTLGEAFGLFLLEAWAAGVPVVEPRHGAFTELVEKTGGGILCEPGDPASLADAIEALLLDPERARALGEAGREAVRKDFSVEEIARQTVRVYEEAAAARAAALKGGA